MEIGIPLRKNRMPQLTNFHKCEVVDREAVLAQLQDEVVELAKYEKKVAELQKQQTQEILQGQVAQGIQQLASLADSINALAIQLETEMLKFKETAIETNQAYRAIQQPTDLTAIGMEQPRLHCWKPFSIWQVHYSAVPAVVKERAKFVLTARIVDLFQAEREGDAHRRAETAQRRRKALERWLAERRRF